VIKPVSSSRIPFAAWRRLGRAWCVVVVVALALAACAAPALAVVPEQAGGGQQTVNSWALTPTGTDPTQPGSRSNLSYTLAPGATIEDSVTLWNYSNVPLKFDLRAIDAVNSEAGDFTLRKDAQASRDAGTWIALGIDQITLPAATSVAIPLTMQVPEDATPGDHTGGVIATSTTEARTGEGGQVLLERRVGTRLYVRVAGPITPRLEVEQVTSDYHSGLNPLAGSLDVTYTVRNSGNVRLGARQQVDITDVFGDVAGKEPKDLPELLPGNTATVRVHFDDVPATLRLSTEVTLEPFAPTSSDVQAPDEFSRSSSAWAIPWSLLVLVALLVVVALAYARHRGRRDRSGPGASGRGTSLPQNPSSNGGRTRTPTPVGGRSGG